MARPEVDSVRARTPVRNRAKSSENAATRRWWNLRVGAKRSTDDVQLCWNFQYYVHEQFNLPSPQPGEMCGLVGTGVLSLLRPPTLSRTALSPLRTGLPFP
jgi:hypothetical protein